MPICILFIYLFEFFCGLAAHHLGLGYLAWSGRPVRVGWKPTYCDITVVQINYLNVKQITQDNIEQARGRSHEDNLVQIFVLYAMQLGGLEVV